MYVDSVAADLADAETTLRPVGFKDWLVRGDTVSDLAVLCWHHSANV